MEQAIAASGGWESFNATYGAKISKGDMKQLHIGLGIEGPEGEKGEAGSPAASTPGPPQRRKFQRPVAQATTVVVQDPLEASAIFEASLEETPAAKLRQKSSTPRSRRASETEVLSEF